MNQFNNDFQSIYCFSGNFYHLYIYLSTYPNEYFVLQFTREILSLKYSVFYFNGTLWDFGWEQKMAGNFKLEDEMESLHVDDI